MSNRPFSELLLYNYRERVHNDYRISSILEESYKYNIEDDTTLAMMYGMDLTNIMSRDIIKYILDERS